MVVVMRCSHKIIGFVLSFLIVLAFLAHSTASADQGTQKTPDSGLDTDFFVSPFKGPAEAPVEIAVFSCFQ